MNITKEGWAKIIGAVLLAIATIAGTLLGVDVQLQNAQQAGPIVGSQAITERINLDSFGDNTISNGGDLTFYSGNRTGQTIKLTGDTGAIDATTLTVTSLVSQVVSFAGEDGNITDTLLVETLTVTGTATAADVSATTITGTLATAAQPNVTRIGTQTTLTATAFILGGATQSGAVRYGRATNYTSDASISTGLPTTATVCGIIGFAGTANMPVITPTISISSSTAFSVTIAPDGLSFYWMCGQ